MRNVLLTLTWVALLGCPNALADQITLRNGDRLTGVIVTLDQKVLVIKSELAGEVRVQWDAVDSIQSTQPLYLGLQDGQIIAGRVATADGKFQVETKDAGTVTITKDTIVTVRNENAETAYNAEIDRLRNPRLTDFWGGYLDTSLSATRGNSRTLNFLLGSKAVRRTTRDVITVYANSVFANNGTTGTTVTTANAINGGVRGDLNVTDRFFVFGFADFFHDEFQKLDLRNVLGGGLGKHIIHTKATVFDVYGGGDYDQAYYSTPLTRKDGEITAGESLSLTLSERSNFSEKFEFFPNVSELGQYRGTFNANITSKLYRWLNWQVNFNDGYVSNPPVGIKKNDILLSTGLRLTFGRPAL